MDDWFNLLLIFIFFVLPILEQIRGRRRKEQPPSAPPREVEAETEEDWGSGARPAPAPAPAPAPGPTSTGGGWSDDWGAWPTPEPVEPVPMETARRQEPVARVDIEEAPEPSRPSEVAPPTEVEAESERWMEVLSRLPVVDEPAPRPGAPAPRTRPRRAPVPTASRTTSRRIDLTGRAELRRAIIASELLGPPLALRSPREVEYD